jgi:SAM-dependent methyltransferase
MTCPPPQRCPLCDLAPQRRRTLANGQPLLQCPQCRLAWWHWPAFAPDQFYDRDYFQSAEESKGYADYAALESGLRRTARGRLKRLRRLRGSQSGALLDVGCGTGVFLDEARQLGWQVQGLEVSPYGCQAARERGLSVQSAAIESADLPAASFDCVTMWDTIEHLSDPVGAVRRAAEALKPGGWLALSTGDVTSWCARLSGRRWHLFNLPEHLFFFSPDSLRRLLEGCGCRVAQMRYEVNWVSTAYIRERLTKTLLGRVPRANSRRTTGWVLPATLFDIVGVYAQRVAARAARVDSKPGDKL